MGRSTVVCVSDGCLLPLMLAQARDKFPSLKKLFTIESSPHCCRMIKEVRIKKYRRSGNFRVKKLSYDKFSCKKNFVETTPSLIVHVNFRKINFRSRHRLQKYFYNENFQIYGITNLLFSLSLSLLHQHSSWRPTV